MALIKPLSMGETPPAGERCALVVCDHTQAGSFTEHDQGRTFFAADMEDVSAVIENAARWADRQGLQVYTRLEDALPHGAIAPKPENEETGDLLRRFMQEQNKS